MVAILTMNGGDTRDDDEPNGGNIDGTPCHNGTTADHDDDPSNGSSSNLKMVCW